MRKTHEASAIQIHEVSKSFRSGKLFPQKILHKINFSVRRGEIFGFLGPNGAGKTTLIKIIVGILRPDAGTSKVFNDQNKGLESATKQAKLLLGYLPERPYFHEFLTAREFLKFHGNLIGLEDDFLGEKIPQALEKVGLRQSADQRLRTFSKGMLQRVGFAQAILHDPQVLVLDEPMSGLDPVGRREMREIITELARNGKTIFFSTHIVHDVEVICSNVGFIQDGKLKGCGSIEDLLGKTIESMEIRFIMPTSKMGSKELLRLRYVPHAKKTMDGWVLEIENAAEKLESEVNSALHEIIENKGVIQAVVPRKSSLEDIFFKESLGQFK